MRLWTLERGSSGSYGKGMLFVMCITPTLATTTKAEIVKATVAGAIQHNIMPSTATSKYTELVKRMLQLERQGAERSVRAYGA